MRAFLEKLANNPVLRFAIQIGVILFFAGTLWANYLSDTRVTKANDAIHDKKLEDLFKLTGDNAAAIRDVISSQQAEKGLQSMRNDYATNQALDHEQRLRLLEYKKRNQ